jgi:hypothetical protein
MRLEHAIQLNRLRGQILAVSIDYGTKVLKEFIKKLDKMPKKQLSCLVKDAEKDYQKILAQNTTLFRSIKLGKPRFF